MSAQKMETKKPTSKAPKNAAASAARQVSTSASRAAPEIDAMKRRRILTGIVVSDKMQKTIIVRVDRLVKHSFYKKYITKTVRVKAHDEKNSAQTGDQVEIVESRPLSKDKRWALRTIVRKAVIHVVENEV